MKFHVSLRYICFWGDEHSLHSFLVLLPQSLSFSPCLLSLTLFLSFLAPSLLDSNLDLVWPAQHELKIGSAWACCLWKPWWVQTTMHFQALRLHVLQKKAGTMHQSTPHDIYFFCQYAVFATYQEMLNDSSMTCEWKIWIDTLRDLVLPLVASFAKPLE